MAFTVYHPDFSIVWGTTEDLKHNNQILVQQQGGVKWCESTIDPFQKSTGWGWSSTYNQNGLVEQHEYFLLVDALHRLKVTSTSSNIWVCAKMGYASMPSKLPLPFYFLGGLSSKFGSIMKYPIFRHPHFTIGSFLDSRQHDCAAICGTSSVFYTPQNAK